MTHPNEQVVRDGFAAFAAGDMEALRRMFAADAVWHVPGRSRLSGSYKGVEEILGYIGRMVEITGGTMVVTVHDVVGNDQHVFAAYNVTAKREHKALRDNQVLVFHVRDGKVTEVWGTSGDQYLSDDFWG